MCISDPINIEVFSELWTRIFSTCEHAHTHNQPNLLSHLALPLSLSLSLASVRECSSFSMSVCLLPFMFVFGFAFTLTLPPVHFGWRIISFDLKVTGIIQLDSSDSVHTRIYIYKNVSNSSLSPLGHCPISNTFKAD